MKIISIDIGIKNLAYCLLEIKKNDFNILKWECLNLCDEDKKCIHKCLKTNKNCNKNAYYYKENNYYCKCHSKKSKYILPINELKMKNIKNLKLKELKEICSKYNINFINKKKTEIIEEIKYFNNKNILDIVKKENANNINLIDIGIRIKNKLNEKITFDIDIVLIENQISPIANRMKTIQGMISQYFIMKDINNIIFVSSYNKLKEFMISKTKITSYKERKILGINIVNNLLKNSNHNKWISYFNEHTKKDDLSDCLLQGYWYIKNIIKKNDILYNI